jgi:MFS family permease
VTTPAHSALVTKTVTISGRFFVTVALHAVHSASTSRENGAVTTDRYLAFTERPPGQGGRSRHRVTTGLAWSLWLLVWPILILGQVLEANSSARGAPANIVVIGGLYATIGAVIATREPGNALGWLCLGVGLFGSLEGFVIPYAAYALIDQPGSLPGGLVAAWVSLWLSYVWGLAFTFVPLLFPTGRVPSPRWRLVAWISAATLVAVALLEAVKPGPMRTTPGLPLNPLGIERAATTLERLRTPLSLLLLAVTVACVLAVIVRFRHARGVERQQLKWFTYAVGLFALLLGSFTLVTTFGGRWVPQAVDEVFFLIGYALIPLATGIAILRYRLYDIDLLINRTLVYGLLTAVLAAAYAGVVLVLGQLFGGVAGSASSWVIATATLAVAAVFQPARRRIQNAVDRRFNRRRYDAARTVEAFGVRLRDHIDLDTLSNELLAVVDQTLEPKATSLWLRPLTDEPHQPRQPSHR